MTGLFRLVVLGSIYTAQNDNANPVFWQVGVCEVTKALFNVLTLNVNEV